VARAAGRDLAGGEAEAGQAACIVVRLNVTRQERNPPGGIEGFESAFEQRGLTGTGGADQIHGEDAELAEALPQRRG